MAKIQEPVDNDRGLITVRLQHPFCAIEGHFSDAFCDAVIQIGETTDSMKGEVARDPENNLRDSTVAWLTQTPENAWLYEQISNFVHKTNELYWQWNITIPESMQYTSYGPGQFYTWHADQRRAPYPDDSRWPGMIRKVSMSILLSDGTDYEGGDFMIEEILVGPNYPEKRIKTIKNVRARGSVILFPSHMYHRVNEITAGTRRSLVCWFIGPPFV